MTIPLYKDDIHLEIIVEMSSLLQSQSMMGSCEKKIITFFHVPSKVLANLIEWT